jgi:hypothetical protein
MFYNVCFNERNEVLKFFNKTQDVKREKRGNMSRHVMSKKKPLIHVTTTINIIFDFSIIIITIIDSYLRLRDSIFFNKKDTNIKEGLSGKQDNATVS